MRVAQSHQQIEPIHSDSVIIVTVIINIPYYIECTIYWQRGMRYLQFFFRSFFMLLIRPPRVRLVGPTQRVHTTPTSRITKSKSNGSRYKIYRLFGCAACAERCVCACHPTHSTIYRMLAKWKWFTTSSTTTTTIRRLCVCEIVINILYTPAPSLHTITQFYFYFALLLLPRRCWCWNESNGIFRAIAVIVRKLFSFSGFPIETTLEFVCFQNSWRLRFAIMIRGRKKVGVSRAVNVFVPVLMLKCG